MQPLKMTIPGRFWDTQLYSGRLYLFDLEGRLTTVDWDRFITEWEIHEDLRLPLECGFLRGDLLYGDKWATVFKHRNMREFISHLFGELAGHRDLIADYGVSRATIREQDSPFPFPHTDATIFKNRMYVTAQSGLFESACNKARGNPVSRNSTRLWDCPTLSVTASYSALSLAGGSEGLYEYSLDDVFHFGSSPELVESRNCVSSNWTYFSIYGSSHRDGGFLVAYENARDEYNVDPRRAERRKLSTLTQEELFTEQGYSWGYRNRLCLVRSGGVQLLSYYPFGKGDDWHDQIEDLGFVRLRPWKGNVVSGAVTPFGVVIECENAVVVVPSDGSDPVTLKGEPVNWRVFPRSKHYQNQLHIVYEDRLEIWSFNHDYFVNQEEKVLGTKPWFRD